MDTWKGIKLPEVPPEFEWQDGAWPLELSVVGLAKKEGFTPIVLWYSSYDKEIKIAPLGTEDATFMMHIGDNPEEVVQLMTTRVLLGMWTD